MNVNAQSEIKEKKYQLSTYTLKLRSWQGIQIKIGFYFRNFSAKGCFLFYLVFLSIPENLVKTNQE